MNADYRLPLTILTSLALLSFGQAAHAKELAFELAEEDAPAILGVSNRFLDNIRSSKSVDRFSPDTFIAYTQQFGRLENGLPTFQVGEDRFYVLIPLVELEKSPNFDAAENQDKFDRDTSDENVLKRRASQDSGAVAAADAEGLGDTQTDGCSDFVDNRSLLTPVRDQGQRGTCVAFAACAELEAIVRGEGDTVDLSENLAYLRFMQEESSTPCTDPGLATFRAAKYLQEHLVCEESRWPYVATDPDILAANNNCKLIDSAPASVSGAPGFGVQEYVYLPRGTETDPDNSIDIRDTATLEKVLDSGRNIVFGAVVAWNSSSVNGVIDVTLGPAGQPIFGSGGHAMMIVGYNKCGQKPYFIVKNSWGTDYGHSGYLYFTYDYMRVYGKYGYYTTELRTGQLP